MDNNDLYNGKALEVAISTFNKRRDEQSLIVLLLTLRESYVWVPCNAIPSDEDQKGLEELVKQFEGHLEDIKDTEYVSKGQMRLVPDILTNGEQFFFPVFTSEEAMGEDYGSHFSKVQRSFLEVLPLAKNNEQNPQGIVINAFSESFVLDKVLYDTLENMTSKFN